MDGSVFVVPIKVDTTVELSLPINIDLVILLKSLFVVLGMCEADSFDAKIVYYQTEGDGCIGIDSIRQG